MSTATFETWPAESVSISPNPARGFLTLETVNITESNVKVYVRDLFGRILSQEPLSAENMRLDITELEAGYYFMELRSADKLAVRQFVKL